MRTLPTTAASIVLLALGAWAGAAHALDWSGVPERELTLFQPGQASWEWVMTERDHSGAPKFREGKNCKGCHEGEEGEIGARIASGEKLEPAPIKGKPGSIVLRAQAAHDAERLYFRLRWTGAPPSGQKMEPEVAAHLTVMLDDGHVKEAARAGCWGGCHDDAIGMASAKPDLDLTKYLGASRIKLTRSGGGANIKSEAELAALLQQGTFLEYWQARIGADGAVSPASGYILDQRHRHATAATRAEGTLAGGEWTVVLSRPLKAAGPGQKEITAGKTYAIGFALHDDYADHRYHFVSLEQTLVLDAGSADIVAVAK